MTEPETSSATAPTPATVRAGLEAQDYLPDDGLVTAIVLALGLRRPLFLEGEPGVGKTEVAKALAAWRGSKLVRLQCHEGIDASQALYEWDVARQLVHLRTVEALGGGDAAAVEHELYDERFLARRPLLEAISHDPADGPAPVLLIDELDRADDEFEAFLLEVLAEWSVTVPELGTVRAVEPPVAVITSNRTREVHDALKRRCLYHWVEHPDAEREVAILRRRVPGLDAGLAGEIAAAVAALRNVGLVKPPGVAEAIDWAAAAQLLGAERLDTETASATLGAVVKDHTDEERLARAGLAAVLAGRGAADA